MSKLHSLRLSVSVALLLGAIALPAQSQQADGAKLFSQQCTACHSNVAGAPPVLGPNLHGVLGCLAGQIKGFAYSAEFKKALAKKNWTPELLDKWLEDPQNVAAGTYMMYQQPDATVRSAIIDYLKTVK